MRLFLRILKRCNTSELNLSKCYHVIRSTPSRIQKHLYDSSIIPKKFNNIFYTRLLCSTGKFVNNPASHFSTSWKPFTEGHEQKCDSDGVGNSNKDSSDSAASFGDSNNQDSGDNGDGYSPYVSPSNPADLVKAVLTLSPVNIPEEWPQVPVIVVKRNPVYPRFVKLIEIKEKELIKIIRKNLKMKQPYAGIFMKKNDDDDREIVNSLDDIYKIGTFAQIHEVQDMGDKLRLVVMGHRRIKINKLLTEDCSDIQEKGKNLSSHRKRFPSDSYKPRFNKPQVQIKPDKVLIVGIDNHPYGEPSKNQETKALIAEVLKTIRDIISLNPLYKEAVSQMIHGNHNLIENPSYLCDLGAAICGSPSTDLQAIMEENDVTKRLYLTLGVLKKEYELGILQQKIGQEVEDKVKTQHRKFMLNEQLKVIRKELGVEKDDKDTIVEKFKKRIENATLPTNISDVLDEEFTKFNLLDPHSSEFNVSRNYLDWLTHLPWGKVSQEKLNIIEARKILDEDHYGMDDVKQRIIEYISVSKLRGTTQGKILCLYGAPGVGKTSIAKSIARTLGREYYRFSVGGMSDVAEIKGHRRTYVGAMPGKIIQCLKKTQTENPLILIDEIDKIGRGHHGDPSSALLEVLDPEQNANFLDYFLDVSVDLSKVLFICTANTPEAIPEALRDRMEMIDVSGYVAQEKIAISSIHLIPQARKASGIKDDQLEINNEALEELIRYYCRESGVRNLQKHIEKIFRKAAYNIVKSGDSDEKTPTIVTKETLQSYVGKPIFSSERLYNHTPVGVVMGLAWTSMGGSTLYIETSFKNIKTLTDSKTPGQNTLKLTGNLGKVMQESAEIALTFIESFIKKNNLNKESFQSQLIHLHVPQGATPKDGPSAGVTIASAYLSLLLNKPIRKDFAMTGELSLTGKVMPVGGIKEKIIAAKRSGVKHILLPNENKKDYHDLADFIKNDIDVAFVSEYKEIYDKIF
ncbi:hypothetical protein A3Q56_03406 [Intoshia linei]|uniref:Lon protease homolog, mitochondrial n=1 Tax=Intoshia linei TaxID=1819745 RepID=A0A177B3L6_9BILA|nr:hypothetical protein A3Q56_03406 [Intoshia linei]